MIMPLWRCRTRELRWLFPIALACALTCTSGVAWAASLQHDQSAQATGVSPRVPHPSTKPCVVDLFVGHAFGRTGDNANMKARPYDFSYRPPAACPGPWAKVVLVADFKVDKGSQYDRTASIWLRGVNLYFGTTVEPSADAASRWEVQRDLTDYSALFGAAGKGSVRINNWIDASTTSRIHATARLRFYPASHRIHAPRVPDQVVALNRSGAGAKKMPTGKQSLSRTLRFPENIRRLYMDLFAQPQLHDEFFYMCQRHKDSAGTRRYALAHTFKDSPKVPRACRGGSFREMQVRIDGQAAGLAPITPWVFAGGIDPYLWRPSPAVETLNFLPYRVDLTPFAGALSDGKKHRVSVRVAGAANYFSVAAALLVYQDPRRSQTGGELTRNTLADKDLAPVVARHGDAPGSGPFQGDLDTRKHTRYTIAGYVNTSDGRVFTTVHNRLRFDNLQTFMVEAPGHLRHGIHQSSHTLASSQSVTHDKTVLHALQTNVAYVLDVNSLRRFEQDKLRDRDVQVHQIFTRRTRRHAGNQPAYTAFVRAGYAGADRIASNISGLGPYRHQGQSSRRFHVFRDSRGNCYQAEVDAQDNKVTTRTRGLGCPAEARTMDWFVHPDGAPSSPDTRP